MPREAPLPRGERTQEPLEWGDARKFPLLDDEGPGYYRLFLVREGRSDLFLSEGIFPAAGSGERALLFDVPAILGLCQLRLECRAPDGVVTSGLVGKYTIAAPLAPSAAPPDDWHDATLQPGWHPWFEGGHSHPGYFRDALGIVHLRGVAVFAREGSTVDQNPCIFELPSEYQPGTSVSFIVPVGEDGFAHVWIRHGRVFVGTIHAGWIEEGGAKYRPIALYSIVLGPVRTSAGISSTPGPPASPYAVWLTGLGDNKAAVIDAVHAVNPTLNLEVVLQVDGRAMLVGDLSLSAAEQLVERLTEAGAKVQITFHGAMAPPPVHPHG